MTSVVPVADGFLAGGSAGPEIGERDARLWHSGDGITWRPVELPRPDAAEIRDIAVSSRGWVAVATTGPAHRPTASVAWRSAAGGAAERVDDEALARGLAVSVAARPDGSLVAVGSDPDERLAMAWLSVDGSAWTSAPDEASRRHPNGGKIRMTDVVVSGDELVAIGNWVGLQFGQGTSWRSRDGLEWDRAPVQPSLAQAEPAAVVGVGGDLVAVGTFGAPDNYLPRAWRTSAP